MSTMNLTQNGNTIALHGDMTNNFIQQMRECAGRFECMFGDAQHVIKTLKKSGSDKLTEQQVLDLLTQGTTKEFYETHNIWGYFCVEPETFRNYTFSPMDSENRDNKYDRLRRGVANFSRKAGFDVYIIHCG